MINNIDIDFEKKTLDLSMPGEKGSSFYLTADNGSQKHSSGEHFGPWL